MFGRLKSLFGERKSAVMDITALLDVANATAAGISVSPERALTCTPVYACVRTIAECIGSMPVHVYRRLPDGSKKRASDHPLAKLLSGWPNPWTPSPELIMQLVADACVHEKGGFAIVTRSGGRPIELLRVPPQAMTVELDDSLEPRYRLSLKDGTQRPFAWPDVLHFRPLNDWAPVRQSREAIALYMTLERHASHLFARGARPSGVLKHKGRMSDPIIERLKHSIFSAHGGGNAGGTAILEEGMEFEALQFTSVDAQFAELRQYQLVEIARSFKVPPSLIADFSRATWSNSEQMAQSFLSFCILPLVTLYQGAIARLLDTEERDQYVVEFLTDSIVRADIAQRFSAYASAIQNGILSPNEVRAMENRPGYPDGDGFFKPLNMGTPGNTPQPASLPKPRAVA